MFGLTLADVFDCAYIMKNTFLEDNDQDQNQDQEKDKDQDKIQDQDQQQNQNEINQIEELSNTHHDLLKKLKTINHLIQNVILDICKSFITRQSLNQIYNFINLISQIEIKKNQ